MKSARTKRRPGRWPDAKSVGRNLPRPPALEWARDMAGYSCRATAIGSHSLLVENHTGILDFTASRVLLDTRSGALCVTGEGLCLRDVRPGALIVDGRIHSLQLPCRGGDAPDEG